MIAALFVEKDGPYYGIEQVDPWDKERDARKYKGPHKVIAHPPCQRWGRYWGGGPMLHGTKKQLLLGDDDGCFAHALWAVRSFGGVIEHPEASHAFAYYGLNRPVLGEWRNADRYGGMVTCVAQGNYGHPARKLTWLYGVGIDFKMLNWMDCTGKQRLEDGFRSKEHRARSSHIVKRISKEQMVHTPNEFTDLLISMVSL